MNFLKNLPKTPAMMALLRFIRVLFYQSLGAATSAAIATVASYQYDTQWGVALGIFLGAVLTALDKWVRAKKTGEL